MITKIFYAENLDPYMVNRLKNPHYMQYEVNVMLYV